MKKALSVFSSTILVLASSSIFASSISCPPIQQIRAAADGLDTIRHGASDGRHYLISTSAKYNHAGLRWIVSAGVQANSSDEALMLAQNQVRSIIKPADDVAYEDEGGYNCGYFDQTYHITVNADADKSVR